MCASHSGGCLTSAGGLLTLCLERLLLLVTKACLAIIFLLWQESVLQKDFTHLSGTPN